MLSGIVSNRCYQEVNSWSPLCNFHVLSLEIATNHQQRGMKGWQREINPQTKIMMEAIKNIFCCLLKVWIIHLQLFVKRKIDNSGREFCFCRNLSVCFLYNEDASLSRHMHLSTLHSLLLNSKLPFFLFFITVLFCCVNLLT